MFPEVSGTLRYEDKKFVQFPHSWSSTCSITAGQVLVLSQLVNYLFYHSWSSTCSITASQLLVLSQLVQYLFYHS